MTVAADELATMIETIRVDLGGVHGWQAQAARTLSVDQAYVSRILKGDRSGVGLSVITRARESFDTYETVKFLDRGPQRDPNDEEFNVMRRLVDLDDDDARRRVLAWAASRWSAHDPRAWVGPKWGDAPPPRSAT